MSEEEIRKRMIKTEELINLLPKSKEAILYDQAARNFYMMLLRGDDPYVVIDEMLVYYTKVKNESLDIIEKAIKLGFIE